MSLSPGSKFGGKQIPLCVGSSLSLKSTSKREKRALQFKARIANLEDTNEKGSDVCSRLV